MRENPKRFLRGLISPSTDVRKNSAQDLHATPSFLPVGTRILAFHIVLKAVHQLAPGGIARSEEVRDRLPTTMGEAQSCAAILWSEFPGEKRAIPFRMITAATPHDSLAGIQLV